MMGAGQSGAVRQAFYAAIQQLIVWRISGASADQLADAFELMARRIRAACPGWTAARFLCVDGSHAFIGDTGQCLVIAPDKRIFRGVATASASALIDLSPASLLTAVAAVQPSLHPLLPAPNLAHGVELQ
jgi:hypothetical protein